MQFLTRHMRWFVIVFAALILLGGLSACTGTYSDTGEQSRETSVNARWNNFQRAEARWPAPTNLTNYPLREALVKFTQHQNLINHPWYTYLISMNGGVIGYFVTETYPISTCNFLSSSEDVRTKGETGITITTAPSYDGIFYGGGGSSAACQDMFFFDSATDVMYTFGGPAIHFTSDQPISIYASAPKIEGVKTEGEVPSDQ